jgi:hypothetical protein
VCRIHCHKVIKLSDAVQDLPRQDTLFVHGVSPTFLRVGEAKARAALAAAAITDGTTTTSTSPSSPNSTPSNVNMLTTSGEAAATSPPREARPVFGRGVYFLGKVCCLICHLSVCVVPLQHRLAARDMMCFSLW